MTKTAGGGMSSRTKSRRRVGGNWRGRIADECAEPRSRGGPTLISASRSSIPLFLSPPHFRGSRLESEAALKARLVCRECRRGDGEKNVRKSRDESLVLEEVPSVARETECGERLRNEATGNRGCPLRGFPSRRGIFQLSA